jgi:diguanylate cyclase (GGDEF)-like protein/PAS domain S-box-containing protein
MYVGQRTVTLAKICSNRERTPSVQTLKNILLIQNDPVAANAIRDALVNSSDGSYRVIQLRYCCEAMDRLAGQKRQGQSIEPVAAILVDLYLPDSSGIETFDRLFQAAPQIPILILTAAQDEDIAKLAVQRGAHEYLLKDHLDPYLLPKAVGSMIERAANAEALFEEKERAQVTLNSIGDAVISTDVAGNVTYLNIVAEGLTGWSQQDAAGRPFEEVFRIIDSTTREEALNPMAFAVRENKTVGLTPNCVLIRRDGVESPIEDSAAPIHDRYGQVTGAVIVFHDVSAARATTLTMSYLAQHDSLTDLPNRVLLNDRLSEAMSLAHRHQRQLAVLFLDVDRFKHINDSLGHMIGDRLLQSIAQRLLSCVRASDTVSRQGGDEFVVLLSEVAHAQDATICADKILEVLRSPHQIDQHEVHITASIGIVTYPEDGTDVDTLMKHADFAMYHAKDNGRDNRQFFKRDLNMRARARQSLENGLRRALERAELVLHYQPKLNLQSGAIVGVEALIRWLHPEFGLVPPADFIPIAEESGLIVPIGRWVIAEACHQARAWQDIGLAPIRIGINISAVELRAKDFVKFMNRILAETGLASRLLELELTETFLMQDSTSTSAVLHALKALGLHLALDDFGTGYSSLNHLKRFPIDTLKIDRSFVQGITTNSDDASIVAAVISMGSHLQMRVVAEGIETGEQLVFLQDHECLFGQGYYFSQPVNARECTQLLRRGIAVNSLQDQPG